MKTLALILVLTSQNISSSTTSTCGVYREAALTWKAVAQERKIELAATKAELVDLQEQEPEVLYHLPDWVWPTLIAASLGGFVVGSYLQLKQ